MTTTATGLRLALFALAASTSLSGLAAQTAPGGRPRRPLPAPSATPTPSPTPATAPAKAPATAPTVKAAPAVAANPSAGPAATAPLSLPKVNPDSFTVPKVPVVRQFTATELRANPRITVGTSKIDLMPMLKDQRSLSNVAQRMGEMPTLVTVEADEIEASELKDLGLTVRSIVTNRLKPGACDNPQNCAKLATVMVRCFDQQTDTQIDASDMQQGKAKDGIAGSNPQAGAQAPNGDVSVTAQAPPMQFLTGFTLGREYEWQLRIEATIPWCLVGCEETYFAEAYAGFSAGLGLHLPFEVSGTYEFERVNNKETATYTPAMKTVNADNAFCSAVQLPSEKHFQGQELLAKFGAWAGLLADLPIIGDFTIGISKDSPLGVDFTADLPGDFNNGQFTPPLPCPVGAAARRWRCATIPPRPRKP